MTTNPVNPRGSPSEPDKTKTVDSKKFREEMQKIEKPREIDPDERSRKKNKQMATQMGDQEDAIDIAPPPSPLNTSFHQKSSRTESVGGAQKSSAAVSNSPAPPPPSPMAPSASSPTPTPSTNQSAAGSPVPSPAYSQPPTVQTAIVPTPVAPTPTPLPSSQQFWGSVDVSTSSPPSSGQTLTEQSSSRYEPPVPGGKPSQNEDDDASEGEEEAPIGGPSAAKKDEAPVEGEKKVVQAFGEGTQGPLKTKKQKKVTSSEGIPLEKGEKKEKNSEKKEGLDEKPLEGETKALLSEDKKGSFFESKELPRQKSLSDLPLPPSTFPKETPPSKLPTPGKEEPFGLTTPTKPTSETPLSSKGETKVSSPEGVREKLARAPSVSEQKSDQEKEGQEQQKPTAPLAAPLILPQFDASIQPLVQAAATQAAPYLSSETMALFHQMVGSIYVTTSQSGISTTEVTLNSPAFANSKFFGSTITIEKYETAPDSLNIRLTGGNEAVKTFNDNLSSLIAAFQNGNFKFRIGRIDTAYQTGKPVFRRKEKEEGKDSGSSKDK